MRLVLTLLLLAGCSKELQDYAKKSKVSEAELNLNKLKSGLKMYAVENGALPKLSIPLTPTTPCCKSASYKCEPSAAAWAAWKDVEFSVDEAHYFQYSLESDGQKVTAKAVGDLDCDGVTIEYVLAASMNPDGTIATDLTKPATVD